MHLQVRRQTRGWKSACAILCASIFIDFFVTSVSASQISGGAQPETMDVQDIDKGKGLGIFNNKSFLVVPMPLSNPTTGSGGALLAAMFFQTDKESKPSVIGLGGFYTSNGSWGGGALAQFAFDNDRYLAKVMAGYADVNYAFYGIGSDATGKSVTLDQSGYMMKGAFQARVAPKFYIGGGLRYLDLNTTFNNPILAGTLLGDLLPVPKLENKVYSLTLNITYDSRNNTFTPSKGQFIDAELAASGRNFINSSGYFK